MLPTPTAQRRILPRGLRIGLCASAFFLLAGCDKRPPELPVTPVDASAAPCLDRNEVIANLAAQGKFWTGEGFTSRAMRVEIWAAEDGRWTLTQTLGTCTKITAGGDGWRSKERTAGSPQASVAPSASSTPGAFPWRVFA